jgi:hypothetical protein
MKMPQIVNNDFNFKKLNSCGLELDDKMKKLDNDWSRSVIFTVKDSIFFN